MIYLGENKINKIGNGNRVYVGTNLVYQHIIDSSEPSTPILSLPDVPFFFNYNAKDYMDGVIPNAEGGEFGEDLVITPQSVNSDSIVLGSSSFAKLYNLKSENPLNRSGNDPLTVVLKVKGLSDNRLLHLLSNRYNGHNFMVRVGEYGGVWLHTMNSAKTKVINVPFDFSQPNICAIRCLNDGYGYAENYTTSEVGPMRETKWGDSARGFTVFGGGDSGLPESFQNGEFYWMYITTEQLTDEQIQQVINFNENK